MPPSASSFFPPGYVGGVAGVFYAFTFASVQDNLLTMFLSEYISVVLLHFVFWVQARVCNFLVLSSDIFNFFKVLRRH